MKKMPTIQGLTTDRQNIIAALAAVRKLGYQAVWKKATGVREFDVEEGRAGFDIRFYDDKGRRADLKSNSFAENGRLQNSLYVGWQSGILESGATAAEDVTFRVLRDELGKFGLDVVCSGPSGNWSIMILPRKIRLSPFLVTFKGVYLGGTAVVWAQNYYSAKEAVIKAWEESGQTTKLYNHEMTAQQLDLDPFSTAVIHFDNGDY